MNEFIVEQFEQERVSQPQPGAGEGSIHKPVPALKDRIRLIIVSRVGSYF